MFIGARLQQADGTYAEAVRIYQAPAYTMCLAWNLSLSDLNGDGRADIVLSGCSGGVRALMQQPSGQFLMELIDANVQTSPGALMDLDGDGRPEVFTTGSGDVRAMRRSSSGAWALAWTPEPSPKSATVVRLVDLNGDGQLDLAMLRVGATYDSYEFAWALRQGSGFGPVRSQAIDPEISGMPSLAVADLTGDGRPDVVLLLPKKVENQIAVLTQTAAGDFSAPVLYPTTDGPSALDVGDVNGDGRSDVLVTHGTSRALGVFLQSADGKLDAERLFAISHTNSGNGNLAVLDINADRRLDIVVGNDVLLGQAVEGVWPASVSGGSRARALASGAASSDRSALTRSAPVRVNASAKSWRGTGLFSALSVGAQAAR